jgi:hypothetical protein
VFRFVNLMSLRYLSQFSSFYVSVFPEYLRLFFSKDFSHFPKPILINYVFFYCNALFK